MGPEYKVIGVQPYSEDDIEDRTIFCGIAVVVGDILMDYLERVPMNQRTGEYDFPRAFNMLHNDNYTVRYVLRKDKSDWISINTLAQLEKAKELL